MKTKTDDLQVQGGQEGGKDQPEVSNDQDPVLSSQLMMHLKKSPMSLVQKNLKKVTYGGTDNDDEPEVSTMDTLEEL